MHPQSARRLFVQPAVGPAGTAREWQQERATPTSTLLLLRAIKTPSIHATGASPGPCGESATTAKLTHEANKTLSVGSSAAQSGRPITRWEIIAARIISASRRVRPFGARCEVLTPAGQLSSAFVMDVGGMEETHATALLAGASHSPFQ